MGMQPREALEAEYATALQRERQLRARSDSLLLDRATAVVDALGWVLGSRPSPISGEPPPIGGVTTVLAGREEDLALDVIYGRRRDLDINRSYAAGVEHALMWARNGTAQPPMTDPGWSS